MPHFDCSCVINVHREGLILVPTLRSIETAKRNAECAGGNVEVIIVADNPDQATLELCHSWGVANRIEIVQERDLGRAREHGINIAESRWVFLHDGDDLYSSNIYSEFIARKQRDDIQERRVYHTEFFIKFGAENEIRRMLPSTDDRFDPLFLVYDWFYSNKCVIDKTLLDDHPLQHNDLIQGLGNEDWSWAGDTISRGIVHDVLKNTACFYRVKEPNLSLGLVPSMTQRSSYLYSSSYIKSGARKSNADKLLNDEPDFITQLQLPATINDLMEEQVAFEPLISNNKKSNPWAINSYLRSILRRSADGAAEILGSLDERKKLFLFLTENESAALPNIIRILKTAQTIYNPSVHQLVIIHEAERDIFISHRLDDEWGTVYLSTRRITQDYAVPDWFLCRLPVRMLVQFPGSTVVDTGTSIFQRLCREFYKILVSQTKRIIFLSLEVVNDPLRGRPQNIQHAIQHLKKSRISRDTKIHFVDIFDSTDAPISLMRKIVAGPSLCESLFIDLTIRSPIFKKHQMDWKVLQSVYKHEVDQDEFMVYAEAGGILSRGFIDRARARCGGSSNELIILPQTIQHYDPQSEAYYFRWYDFSDVPSVIDEIEDRIARGHKVGLAAVILGEELTAQYRQHEDLLAQLKDLRQNGGLQSVVTLGGNDSGLALVTTSENQNSLRAARRCVGGDPRSKPSGTTYSKTILQKYAVAFTGSDYLSSYRDARDVETIETYLKIWTADRGAYISFTPLPSERLLSDGLSPEARQWKSLAWLPTIKFFLEPYTVDVANQNAVASGAAAASLLPTAFHDMLEILRSRADTFCPPFNLSDIQWRGPENYKENFVAATLREIGGSLSGGSFILVPYLEAGGAELVATLHLRAWKAQGIANSKIILTEGSSIVENYRQFAADTIDLPSIISGATGRQYPHDYAIEDRTKLLEIFLTAAMPTRLFSVQSYTTALLLTRTKPAPLVEFALFCPHIDVDGRISGFQNMIPAIDHNIDAYVSDNTTFAAEASRTYGVRLEKIKTIFYPPDEQRVRDVRGRRAGSHNSPEVLWASRIDHQKNPGMLISIARAMPDLTFHMYGRRVLNDTDFDIGRLPVNLRFHGEFSSISELMNRKYLCYLYTSRFDGMPNVLMEMAAAGLPVVTPNVGGIADFFGNDWPGFVGDGGDIESYTNVIRKLRDPDLFKSMIERQETALRQRSFENLRASLFEFTREVPSVMISPNKFTI